MKKWTVFLLFYLAVSGLFAQKIYWSDITDNDIEELKSITGDFLNQLDKGQSDELKPILAEDKIIFGGEIWLDQQQLIDTLMNISRNKSFDNPEISGYRFDDFLESYTRNPIINEVYKVFDNHSVIIHVKYEYRGGREDALLVFRKERDHWILNGVSGFGIPFNDHTPKELNVNNYNMEKIAEADITIPIPAGFSEPDHQKNQINYYLKEETERDAVFQIVVDEPKKKMYFYTFKLVEFNNQHYEMSDLTVRYLPFGILFEYIVVDPYGSKNKGFTVGLQNNQRSVIIQFYSFLEVYLDRQDTIDKVFNNIRLN